ncbi:hypothetical protein K8640_36985 [Myxococcus sp. XM-1-1-1]|jgi:hypothetical protein|uniref:MXAN_5187 C-terminal domain-containing protein n=1 Tax=Myxococcus sp. XM-1-1-1 TaxID=2874602 RepID=UPI001CBD4E07|nr:MXAN_5187 C-terminal domain-containing protein [Myxococcus sp. XM-1-1-1]MBZ4413832.1 hypothetical protein [Myxococcus sp. XM-1-1-1]BDT30764.1 hypothetical protein MFMH1_04330 [Myxococcus sp. MH1]
MPPPDARQSAAKSPATKAPADTSSSEAVLHECEALEAELAALRNLFEQYFLGNERNPPTRAHEDFKKRVNKLKTSFIRSTAAKFRVGSIHSKFLTYERLWVRTLQEIEAGTYKRDLFKARRRAEVRGGSANKDAKKGVVELPEDISDMDFEEVEEVLRPRPVNEPPLAAAIAAAAVAASTPSAGGTPFRGTPAVASASAAPSVAPVAAPAGSRGGIPGIAPLTPAVAPVTGTPARGLPTVTSPLAGTPARGSAAVPPGMAAKPAGTPVPVARPSAAPVAASRPAAPVASAAPKPAAAGGGGMSDDKLRAVYDAYVTAKRRCQEDTSKMSYESVAATLRKQVPELLKQHNAKAVEFKVVIKDGKASLKAVPK